MPSREVATLEALVEGDDDLGVLIGTLVGLPFDLGPAFDADPSLWERLTRRVDEVGDRALDKRETAAALEWQLALRQLLALRITGHRNRRELDWQVEALTTRMANRWITAEIADLPAAPMPADADEFAGWLTDCLVSHPAPDHPMFSYLEAEGDAEAFRYFVAQEHLVSADFVDLLALAQVGVPTAWKGEIAHNYWDEMGEGDITRTHAGMFRDVLAALNITDDEYPPCLGALV